MQRCIIYLDCTRIPRKFVRIFIAPILLKFPDKYPVLPILNETLMDMKNKLMDMKNKTLQHFQKLFLMSI